MDTRLPRRWPSHGTLHPGCVGPRHCGGARYCRTQEFESAQLVARLGSRRRTGRHPRSTIPPQPLNEHVVQPAALLVHAYVDVVVSEKAGERFRSELGPLDLTACRNAVMPPRAPRRRSRCRACSTSARKAPGLQRSRPCPVFWWRSPGLSWRAAQCLAAKGLVKCYGDRVERDRGLRKCVQDGESATCSTLGDTEKLTLPR